MDLGISVAPVTIDNSEWVYARAYALALARDDAEAAGRIAAAYFAHMDEMFEFSNACRSISSIPTRSASRSKSQETLRSSAIETSSIGREYGVRDLTMVAGLAGDAVSAESAGEW